MGFGISDALNTASQLDLSAFDKEISKHLKGLQQHGDTYKPKGDYNWRAYNNAQRLSGHTLLTNKAGESISMVTGLIDHRTGRLLYDPEVGGETGVVFMRGSTKMPLSEALGGKFLTGERFEKEWGAGAAAVHSKAAEHRDDGPISMEDYQEMIRLLSLVRGFS